MSFIPDKILLVNVLYIKNTDKAPQVEPLFGLPRDMLFEECF